ncbi:type II secretion system protein GspH [Vibrio ponticus]|uniref:Type II secretion system protein H n=1 Tax=Vibrio ponticus TaxID=265668 RepID=A0A3N3E0I8_9VIBR|nr:type II secretion system minor pseudopilin GspH [Vibrio ponticus]OLQ86561.1 type II secretion system protein GspH [Vibrio ponticus]ROV60265.1 type II secretion system protein GspH [Vibrio ponticus]
MPKSKGFTLLEVLLVVALLAVTVTTVVFALPDNQRDEAKQQASALWHRLQLLNEEALLSGRDYGLRVDEKKATYYLQQLEEKGWQKLSLDRIPYESKLQEGVAVKFTLGGSVWQDQERLFEPTSLFDEDMFAEFEEQKQLPQPQVFFMSSGEITPFSIAIYPSDADIEQSAWQVVAKENGQIILLAPGEQDEAQ